MSATRVELTISFWVDNHPADKGISDEDADRITDEILAAAEKVPGVQWGTAQAERWNEGEE